MHIITGATGHIGSAVAQTLLDKGQDVLIITRSHQKGEEWKQKGAEVAIVDVNDCEALHEVFKRGKRLFLLNPPAAPDTDMIEEERKTMQSMLCALRDTNIEKIVAESTYGAHPGEGSGDLNVLYEMEQGLKDLNIPVSIIRGAYYMSNWDVQLELAKKTGMVRSLYPVGFKIPMAAPGDIGEYAAKLMMEPVGNTGLHYVEGPEPYSPAEVAEAFSEMLHKRVEAVETPQSQWIPTLEKMGFSQKAAVAMANMTKFVLQQNYEMADFPTRGRTSLRRYIKNLVKAASTKSSVELMPA
ncbi:MAG: NAD-dependent epimerase/dehydratase family protein [Chitinophagaceae bacterium]|nr:MAG: NAD-dependent epimerase/dehydratase family protein [Chitinophagaceae bacterium]